MRIDWAGSPNAASSDARIMRDGNLIHFGRILARLADVGRLCFRPKSIGFGPIPAKVGPEAAKFG